MIGVPRWWLAGIPRRRSPDGVSCVCWRDSSCAIDRGFHCSEFGVESGWFVLVYGETIAVRPGWKITVCQIDCRRSGRGWRFVFDG
jgi:hypothetical protein